MQRARAILQRASKAAGDLSAALGPLSSALSSARGSCPSCGKEALWVEGLPGPAALCLTCRRAFIELYRWEGGSLRPGAHGGLPRVRGRIVQRAAIPSGLASALCLGGAGMMAQAASAIASMIPLSAYMAVEGVYADAGETHESLRLSPLARAFATASAAAFLGVASGQAGMDLASRSHSYMIRAARRPPRFALVVMQGETSLQAEERLAKRLPATSWFICAYVGRICQGGRGMVI